MEDLASYEALLENPVSINYSGMLPPSPYERATVTESWVGLGIEAKWRVVRITCVRRRKQSPISLTHASLHEEVVDV